MQAALDAGFAMSRHESRVRSLQCQAPYNDDLFNQQHLDVYRGLDNCLRN